jgi:DNA-nicking Smr family endonuclease
MGNLFSSRGDDDILTSTSSSGSSLLQPSVLIAAGLLRSEARQLQLAAKAASDQSQLAYHSGDKSQAKTLSNKKATLYAQMNGKNDQAAELIFEHFNQGRSNNIIDLHGLYVAEALKYLQRKLDKCRSENISQLTVITGMGNNSPNKIAKIKPEVEKFARKNHLQIVPFDGHVVINLTTDGQHETTRYRDTNACTIQ